MALTMPLAVPIFAVALAYFVALSAKEWTWVFVSADSGDWLASASMWMVPQPLGSPLYVLLGRAVEWFTQETGLGTLPMNMTILLSALPSAITVALVYKTVGKITKRRVVGLASAAVLMGSAVFLTQSTVLEQYALAAMFVALGYWCYINGWKKRTGLALGLGTAVHVVLLPIALIWLAVELITQWKKKKEVIKGWRAAAVVFVATGIAPYLMIPVLMAMDTPPFMAGSLSAGNLMQYVVGVGNAIVGTISVVDFPERLWLFTGLVLLSLGIAIVPLIAAIKGERPYKKEMWVAVGTVMFAVWYFTTNMDPSTWTFLTLAMPLVAVLVGIGLDRLTRDRIVDEGWGKNKRTVFKWESRRIVVVVLIGALALASLNGTFLNAQALTNEEPIAREYEERLRGMEEGAVVLTLPGAYSMGLFYVMATGREDLTPLMWYDSGSGVAEGGMGKDYYEWLEEEKGLGTGEVGEGGSEPLGIIMAAISQGRKVYIAEDVERIELGLKSENWEKFVKRIEIKEGEEGMVREIVGVKCPCDED